MCVKPVVLVISNLPIVAATVCNLLAGRYSVATRTWAGWSQPLPEGAALVVADVTRGASPPPLPVLASTLESPRLLVCSLHRNEVEDYHVRAGALRHVGSLPSLMSL